MTRDEKIAARSQLLKVLAERKEARIKWVLKDNEPYTNAELNEIIKELEDSIYTGSQGGYDANGTPTE